MSLRVVARLTARPESADLLKSELLTLVEPTRKETGCRQYELLENRADPCELVFVEEWDDDAALDAHLAAPHVTTVLAKVPPMLAAEPVIGRYNLLA